MKNITPRKAFQEVKNKGRQLAESLGHRISRKQLSRNYWQLAPYYVACQAVCERCGDEMRLYMNWDEDDRGMVTEEAHGKNDESYATQFKCKA